MYPTADCEKTQAPMAPGCDEGFNPLKRRGYAESSNQVSRAIMSSEEIVAEYFKYHAPNEITIPKFAAINQAAKNFAEVVLANCPPGTDRVGVIQYLRLARMLANASIALNGLSL